MPNYNCALGFAIFITAFIWSCKPSDTQTSPNIIILLADDLGYSDLSCFGGNSHTPHLDQLASEGMLFTDFYSAAPNCSPARAGLLTGRDPSKVGIYNYLPTGHPMHLQSEYVTIAEMAKSKNYQTAHFGKWHLSTLSADQDLGQPQPSDQGFNYSFGTTNNVQPSHLNPVNFIRNGHKVGPVQGYACDILVDEALHWISRYTPNQPFFMFLAFNEPHKKVASPPDLVKKYAGYPPLHAEYLANVENLDKAIGFLLDSLKQMNLLDNTFILFASDNGSYRNGSNEPFLGGKSFVYEGGIRVPGIMCWPGHIQPGQKIETPVGLIDLMPTLCKLMAVEHPSPSQLDGIDITPLFEGQSINRIQPLSWFFYRTTPEIALRMDNYVILGRSDDSIQLTHPMTQPAMDHIKRMSLQSYELYDLSADPGQSKNLFEMAPELDIYVQAINNQLQLIQQEGPYWDQLPPAEQTTKMKSEWRKLRPQGFSN